MSEVFSAGKKLGFGLMRLPKADGKIDVAAVSRMVDHFMERGFTYFDTAYAYNGSEEAIRRALIDRYPRESYTIADKLPLFSADGDERNLPKLTETSLARLGVDFFDYYLIHAIRDREIVDRLHAWEYMKTLKQRGIARHIGFSFHGSSALLEELLTDHPETEFVQLQINYIDWESPVVESRRCYEICCAHGVPVVVMEPVKGGSLVNLTDECAAPLRALSSGSMASYAIRYAASLENVKIVLSGMSDMAQMEDNTSYMQAFRPLTQEERAAIDQVIVEYKKRLLVPCTGCAYCVAGCPAGIKIPALIEVLNARELFSDAAYVKGRYDFTASKGQPASACLSCGACEEICPQRLPVREILGRCVSVFEKTEGETI